MDQLNWKLVRNVDPKNATHILTNGQTKISIYIGEVDEPNLTALREQLERGATVSDKDRPWLKVLREKHTELLQRLQSNG